MAPIHRCVAVSCFFSLLAFGVAGNLLAHDYFVIQVVDEETGRGVPLVELKTVHKVAYWTDSNGIIAFNEPGLIDQDVFFHIRSHGYEYPKDMFDNRGVKLKITRRGSAQIKIKRVNIAERLYRITGEGIYHDSVLTGRRVLLKRPLLSGQVMGQDTVIATPYAGKIFWCWGDTDRPSYPLGNFGASGATSELPGRGGLDPGTGVDLTYFTDKTGFSKPMCPDFGPGLQWIESLLTIDDAQGRERLLARVASADGLKGTHDWHLAMFNDEKQIFESLVRWEIHDSHDVATPFRARLGTNEYFYLYPNYRVKADLPSLSNLAAYEAFTCLAPGSRYEGGASKLNRVDGRLHYEWQIGAQRIDGPRLRELIRTGLLKPEEAWRQLYDVETGKPVQADRGSVCWNQYRRCWVMIAGGLPGDIWFAEADTPLGPWVYARRVVTHDHYNFYNPTQHSFFDQEGGRLIYFEGTYTASFSGAKEQTPRYDYNQIMYRLNLDDARLMLPSPVYAVRQPDNTIRWMMREEIDGTGSWERIESIPFFAIPGNRRYDGLLPVCAAVTNGAALLQQVPSLSQRNETRALFFGVAATNAPASGKPESERPFRSSTLVPVYEYRHRGDGTRLYSTQPNIEDEHLVRSAEALCLAWPNPMALLILDTMAKPVPRPTH